MTDLQPREGANISTRASSKRESPPPSGLFEPLLGGPPAIALDQKGRLRICNDAYLKLAASFEPPLPTVPGGSFAVPNSVLARIVKGGPSVRHDWQRTQGTLSRHLSFDLWSPADDTEHVILGLVREDVETNSLTQSLRHAEARFEDIARLSNDWVWEIDREFHFRFVSERIFEMIGVPARFLLGQVLNVCGRFDGFPESNYAGHPSREAMSPFRNVHYEMQTADGERRLFRLSGVPIFESDTGQFLGFRGIAHDMSVQAMAEARVFAAQTRLVDAIESIPQGFALFDGSDILLLCNSAYDELLTGSNGQTLVLGTRYAEILKSSANAGRFSGTNEETAAFMAACIDHHRQVTERFEFQLSDGRWVLKSVDRTGDGGLVEVWDDITEIKQREASLRLAEEKTRRALDLAEAGNRVKAEFLATMSHELRTPLNAIIGFSEIIKDEIYGPTGHASYKEYAADIHSSGTHLLSIISDILEFSKIEAGKLQLSETIVNLRSILETSIRIIEARAQQGAVKLNIELPADLPRLKADETRLKQIVINLLSNAVKFTPSGGTVRLSATADQKDGCRFVVSDTGIGMAPEDIPLALAPFGQIESQLSRRFEGTGLGLTLAKTLVEAHGGLLTLESAPNVGTTVTVSLPASRVVPR